MTDQAGRPCETEAAGCCVSCHGHGGTYYGPCSDCYGTGHAHAPDPTCGVVTDQADTAPIGEQQLSTTRFAWRALCGDVPTRPDLWLPCDREPGHAGPHTWPTNPAYTPALVAEVRQLRAENDRLTRAVATDAPYCEACADADPEKPLCDACYRWVLDESYAGVERQRDTARAERDRAFTERDTADATRIRLAAELAAAHDREVERLRLIRRRILNTVDPAMPGPDVRLAAVAVVDEAANALAALSQSGQPTKGEPA